MEKGTGQVYLHLCPFIYPNFYGMQEMIVHSTAGSIGNGVKIRYEITVWHGQSGQIGVNEEPPCKLGY